MFSFNEFLTESKSKERDFNLNDAKGKLYEILSGSHLAHGTHKSGIPNKFLTHYRDEEGKSPEEVHDYIKGELDKRNPGMYDTINDHARHASDYMRKKLFDDGHHQIHDVAWTSQAGDHKRFTGVDDPNSDADLMLHTNKGYLGMSLKYGTSKNMNLRNNGLEKLEEMSNSPKGSITKHREEHQQNLKNIGITNHIDYKTKRDSEDPIHQDQVARAETSATNAQVGMAKQMSESLGKMKHEHLKDYINNVIAPQNYFQHYRMHTRPDSDENHSAVSHHMEDVQQGRHLLDSFSNLRAKPHNNGITFQIEGKRHGSEKYEPVLDQAIKKGSGPTKGFASTTKAPFLTKPDTAAPAETKKLAKLPAASSIVPPAKPTKEVMKPKPKPLRKVMSKAVSSNVNVQKLAVTAQANKKARVGNDGSVGGFQF